MSTASLEKNNKKYKISNEKVLELLFKEVGTPFNEIKISSVNVYGDFYRVNVWNSINHSFLTSVGYISASYFFSVDEEKISLKQVYTKELAWVK